MNVQIDPGLIAKSGVDLLTDRIERAPLVLLLPGKMEVFEVPGAIRFESHIRGVSDSVSHQVSLEILHRAKINDDAQLIDCLYHDILIGMASHLI